MYCQATLVVTPVDPLQERSRDYACFTCEPGMDPTALMWQSSRVLDFPWGPDQQFVAEFTTQGETTIWNFRTEDAYYAVLLQEVPAPLPERPLRVLLEFAVQQTDPAVLIDLQGLRGNMASLVEGALRQFITQDDRIQSPLLEHAAVRLVGVDTD